MARRAIGSRELGIDLASGCPPELFKWFLACLLFGKPIQQRVAKRAYLEFVTARLLTPRAILRAGWDRLVEVLDRGHYVRFDFSTATKLLDVSAALVAQYGSLARLLEASTSRADAARRLQAFKGVGPTTTRIFLRDVAALCPRPGRVPRARPVRRQRRLSGRCVAESGPGVAWQPPCTRHTTT
ncbi:MAG: DNA methylase [Candidatus Rokubacteria bacterium]|nr:DNA methylase [Candidatus Rokubacteria bacterium]